MTKTQGVIATMETTTLMVAVTGAPGGAGVAVSNSVASSSVVVTNTSNGAALQYKAGAGAWLMLVPSEGIELPIDLSTTALLLRRARYDGGLASAQLVIASKATLGTSEAGLPIAAGGAVVATITGTGVVGSPLTATLPAGYVGTLQFTRSTKATTPVKSNIADAVATAVNSLSYTPVSGDTVYNIGCDTSNVVAPSAGVSISAAPAPALRAFSVTESFSSGDQVTYAGGLYTFTANHAPGNWTGADVAYVAQSGARVFNALGMSKPFGVVGNWSPGSPATATTSTPPSSRAIKQHMEAPFTRARVALFQREPTPIRGFAMSVASTEVEAVDTMSNAIDPIVGGVAYSVTRANNANGLLRLTWDAALRSPVLPPGSVATPGQNGVTGLSVVVSDWGACQSVPVAAGKRPMIVSRVSQIGNIGDSEANITVSALTQEYNKFAANNPSARLYYCPSVGNGDHVADPTLSKAAGNVYNPASTGAWKNVGIIVDHATIPTRVFAGFGDSITEGYSWWQNAVWALSTVNAPCYVANFGCSTNRAAQYQALFNTMIRQDIPMTDIVMPSFSPNEIPLTSESQADAFIARLQSVVATCMAFNRRLYIWTSYCAKTTRYSNNPGGVAAVNKINDWVRTEAAKPGAQFVMCEIEAGWNNATMNGDNTHPNGTGIIYMQNQLMPVIQTGA